MAIWQVTLRGSEVDPVSDMDGEADCLRAAAVCANMVVELFLALADLQVSPAVRGIHRLGETGNGETTVTSLSRTTNLNQPLRRRTCFT